MSSNRLSRTPHKQISPRMIELARGYITNPEAYWNVGETRQVRKLKNAVQSAGGLGADVFAVAEEAMAIATLRSMYASPPLYISNIGSSGSHWLEGMLAHAPKLINCGEVYLPRSILTELRKSSSVDADYFLHAIYALHSRKMGPHLIEGSFINSAHHARISLFVSLTPGSKCILLIRNPIDIVISRTFRKQEYRQEIAVGVDDKTYLEQNCNVVNRFYATALTQKFDAIVKYEELVSDPELALRRVLIAIDVQMDDRVLAKAVSSTQAESIKAVIDGGGKATTNLFVGERDPIDPALLAMASDNLADICGRLGYFGSGQLNTEDQTFSRLT
jgi:hypothetical protein